MVKLVQQRTETAVTLLVAGAFFMEMLDGTVITTALPDIARSFGVSAVALNVGITAYLLALAVFIPLAGWLADRFGARTVFGGAILLFTAASALCGMSNSLRTFAAARLLQGAGGAAMVPVGRLTVLRMTKKERLVAALGMIVWPGLVAPVLGPPLGGFIVMHLSWRWIFLLNVPLGAIGLLLTLLLVPATRLGTQRALDVRGFLLSGGSLGLMVYGIDALGNGHGSVAAACGMVISGLFLGVWGVRHLKRHHRPLLDLSPICIPTFAVVLWGGSLLRLTIGALPFLLPLLFQLVFGLDPLTSGALLLALFAGNLAMKSLTSTTLRRLGFRTVMLGNGLLMAATILLCALVDRDTPHWLLAVLLFASGAFRSMQFTALSIIQFADIPDLELADANTLAAMLQQLTMGLGVVVGAGLLNGSAWLQGRFGGVPDASDFRAAFAVLATLAVLGLIDTVKLPRDAGRRISGHSPTSE